MTKLSGAWAPRHAVLGPQSHGLRCSIIRDDGDPCSRDVPAESPISACAQHLMAAYTYCDNLIEDQVRWIRAGEAIPHRTLIVDPVVYYVRIGYYVKIGTTAHFANRMGTLGVDDVLALEWGTFALERLRHQQFADCRAHNAPGRELFYPNHELHDHIEKVKAEWRDGADGYNDAEVIAKVFALRASLGG